MTPVMRRWAPWGLLLLVAAVGLAFGLQSGHGAPATLDARVQHIASQVRCPVCSGETVAESQAAPSVAIRNQIRSDLQRGETQGQILASLVGSYGPGILEKPQASGIGVLVWVLPVVAVAAGAAVLYVVVGRWRRPGGEEIDRDGTGEAGATAEGDGAEGDGAGPAGRPVGSGPGPGDEPAPGPGPADGRTRPVLASVGARTSTAAVTAAPDADRAPAGPDAMPAAGGEGGGGPGDGRVDPHAEPEPAVTGSGPARAGGHRRRILAGAGAAVVAAGISWAVVASSGTRLPGESITGQVLPAEQVAADLQAALDAENRGDLVSALRDYQKILDAEPQQVQALTGKGWVLAQTGEPALLQQGLTALTAAEKSDPTYAPAHIYRGLALLGEGDYGDSIPELKWYLAHDPAPQLTAKVQSALAQAEKSAAAAAGAPSPTTVAPAGG